MKLDSLSKSNHEDIISCKIRGMYIPRAIVYYCEETRYIYLLQDYREGSFPAGASEVSRKYGVSKSWTVTNGAKSELESFSIGVSDIKVIGKWRPSGSGESSTISASVRSLKGLEGEIVKYNESTEGVLYRDNETGYWFLFSNTMQGVYPWSSKYNRSQAEAIIYEITGSRYRYSYFISRNDSDIGSCIKLTGKSITFNQSYTRRRLEEEKLERDSREIKRAEALSRSYHSAGIGFLDTSDRVILWPSDLSDSFKSTYVDTDDTETSIEIKKEKKTRRPVEVESMKSIEV